MPKKTSRRPIERKVAETYTWWGKSLVFIKKTKVKIWQAVFVISFITGAAVTLVWSIANNIHPFSRADYNIGDINGILTVATEKDVYQTGEQIKLTSVAAPSGGGGGGGGGSTPLGEAVLGVQISDNSEQTEPKINGYIVELQAEPLIVQEQKLKLEAAKNAALLQGLSKVSPLRYYYQFFKDIDERDIERGLERHQAILRQERERAKELISQRRQSFQRSAPAGGLVVAEYEKVFNGLAVNVSRQEAERIAGLQEVKRVSPNYEVRPFLMDSVPLIKADQAWQADYTGKGVTIGIIDTGIDYLHPDLGNAKLGENNKVIGGYDFFNNDDDPIDDHGHGTHVAGIAAGNGALKGIAPDARLYAYKVLGFDGGGYLDDIMAAVERSVDPNQDGDFSDRLDIISLSLGMYCFGSGYNSDCGPDDVISRTIDNVVSAGVTAVISAGNAGEWGEGTIASPGTARKAITVAASDKTDNIAYFSSRGPVVWKNNKGQAQMLIKPDITAPGVNICAAQWASAWQDRQCLDDEHTAISGTSMAAPHVSGLAALLKQKNPDWDPLEIKLALRSSADNIGQDIFTQGYGRINAWQAVNAARPPLARLELIAGSRGLVNITGTAGSANFKEYYLFVGEGRSPSEFRQFYTSQQPAEDGVLFANFNLGALTNGYNTIMLKVYDVNGNVSVDQTLIYVDNNILISPLSHDIYRLGVKLPIVGIINDLSYVIQWRKNGDSQWSSAGVVNNPQAVVNQETELGVLDTNILSLGYYDLRVVVGDDTSSNPDIEQVSQLYFDPALREGWPVRIQFDSFDNTSLNAGDLEQPMRIVTANSQPIEAMMLAQKDGKYVMEKRPFQNADELNAFLQTDYSSQSLYWHPGRIMPVAVDLTGNAKKEVLVWQAGSPPMIKIFNDGGDLLKVIEVGAAGVPGGNLSLPAVDDINRDGQQDIVVYVPDFDNIISRVYAFNYDGTLVDGYPLTLPFSNYSHITIADTNRNGFPEIIAVDNLPRSLANITIIENADIISQFQIPNSEWRSFNLEALYPNTAVGNFDDDDDLEIVIVWSGNDGNISVYNIDGSLVAGWPKLNSGWGWGAEWPTDYIFSSPVVGDINNDGSDDIVIGKYLEGIYALDKQGKIFDGWPILRGPAFSIVTVDSYSFISTPALADVNNDGYLEVALSVFASSFFDIFDSEVYLVDYQGKTLDNWPQKINWPNFFSLEVADIDSDNVLDVIAVDDDEVYAWNVLGAKIKNFPKLIELSHTSINSGASVVDLDSDGALELLAVSEDVLSTVGPFDANKMRSSIYAWDLESGYNKNSLPWPTFQRDIGRTGNYVYRQRPQSSIVNLGSADIVGELIMKIQRYGDSGWSDYQTFFNGGKGGYFTIQPGGSIALKELFDQFQTAIYESGRYRLTAQLATQGQVINTALGALLDEWEFTVQGEDYGYLDSDGGLNYNLAGAVVNKNTAANFADVCVDSQSLEEFYIDFSGSQPAAVSATKECAYGCQNGACASEPPQYLLKRPISCVSGWGACWEHNATHYLKPLPEGVKNSYFLHANGRADFPNIKINSADSKLLLSVVDGSGNSSDGFFFKILINEQEAYASPLIINSPPPLPIEVNLSAYNGQIISVSFVSEMNNNYGWDQAVALDPLITYATAAPDLSPLAAPDNCVSGWGECWERNRQYNKGMPAGTRNSYFLHANGRADFNNIAVDMPKPELSLALLEGSNTSYDGFFFKILVNEQEAFSSPLITKEAPVLPVKVDMSAYAGQSVNISFVSDMNGNYSWDQVVVIDPWLASSNELPKLTASASGEESLNHPKIVLSGHLYKEAAAFEFDASGDGFTISQLRLKAEPELAANIKSAWLNYTNKLGEKQAKEAVFYPPAASSGVPWEADFSGLDVDVPDQSIGAVGIDLEFKTFAGAPAPLGARGKIYLDTGKEGVLAASYAGIEVKQLANIGDLVASGWLYLRRGKPVFNVVKLDSDVPWTNQAVLKFEVLADFGDIEFKQLGFNVRAEGVEVNDLKLYLAGASAPLSAVGSSPDSSGNVKFTVGALDSNDAEFIPSGVAKVYEVKGAVSGWDDINDRLTIKFKPDDNYVADSAATVLLGDYYNVWSDRSVSPHDINSQDWTNGYLVEMGGEQVFDGGVFTINAPELSLNPLNTSISRNERAKIYEFAVVNKDDDTLGLKQFALDLSWINEGDSDVFLSLENIKLYRDEADITDAVTISSQGGGKGTDVKAANQATQDIGQMFFGFEQEQIAAAAVYTVTAIPRNFEKGAASIDTVSLKLEKDGEASFTEQVRFLWSVNNSWNNGYMVDSLPLSEQLLEAAF